MMPGERGDGATAGRAAALAVPASRTAWALHKPWVRQGTSSAVCQDGEQAHSTQPTPHIPPAPSRRLR